MSWVVFHKSPLFQSGDLLRIENDAICSRVKSIILATTDEQNATVLSNVRFDLSSYPIHSNGLAVYVGSYYDYYVSTWEGHLCFYRGTLIDMATTVVDLSKL